MIRNFRAWRMRDALAPANVEMGCALRGRMIRTTCIQAGIGDVSSLFSRIFSASRTGLDQGRTSDIDYRLLDTVTAHVGDDPGGHRDRAGDDHLPGDRTASAGGADRRDLGGVRHSADLSCRLGRPVHGSRQRRPSGVDRLWIAGRRLRRFLAVRKFRGDVAAAHRAVRHRPSVSDGEPANALHQVLGPARPRLGVRQLSRRQRDRAGAWPLYHCMVRRFSDGAAD